MKTKNLKKSLNKFEKIMNELKKQFPHGHPDFIPMTIEEIELHSKKNYDYAAGGKPTGNFDRVGKIVEMYPNIKWWRPQNVAIFYSLKQLDAYLWLENGDREGGVENKSTRLGDISVYSKIARMIINNSKRNKI